MPRRPLSITPLLLVSLFLIISTAFSAQAGWLHDQVQISAPTVRAVEPPAPDATAEQLEKSADDLRGEKLFLDALDYYRAALAKKPNTASIYNQMGIAELPMLCYSEAETSVERATMSDSDYADAYNNLGVVYYETRKYCKALDK